MRFEQALQAMREGNKVKRPSQYNPRTIFDGSIIEICRWNGKEQIDYEPLNSIQCSNILAEDWEIVEDEPQS